MALHVEIEPRGHKPARTVGRGDLLRLLEVHGDSKLEAMAILLGYTLPTPDKQPKARRGTPLPLVSTSAESEHPPDSSPGAAGRMQQQTRRRAPVQFFAATKRSRVVHLPVIEDKPIHEPIAADLDKRPPRHEALVPWRRLWPFLKQILGSCGMDHSLDIDAAVEEIARGEILRRLPLSRYQQWALAFQVMADFSHRLLPFWEDFNSLLARLHNIRGEAGVELLMVRGSPESGCERWRAPRPRPPYPYQLPENGTPLLILSDLGLLGTDAERAAWANFGRNLVMQGLCPVVLTPTPRRFWDPALLHWFRPVCWDRDQRLTGPVLRQTHLPEASSLKDKDPGAEHLLALLAPAIQVQPALLRAVRQRLPVSSADVGSEGRTWNHPRVKAAWDAYRYADHECIAHYQEEFLKQPESLQKMAGDMIRRYHAHLSPLIAMDERALIAKLCKKPDGEAERFMQRLPATIRATANANGTIPKNIKAFARRFSDRQSPIRWRDPVRSAIYTEALQHELLSETIDDYPPGFELNAVSQMLESEQSPRRWQIWQRGMALVFTPGLGTKMGSPVGDIETSIGQIQIETDRRRGQGDHPLRLNKEPHWTHIPLPEQGGLTLKGDDHLRIEPLPHPDEIPSMGRDNEGLYLEFQQGDEIQRKYWISPSCRRNDNERDETLTQGHFPSAGKPADTGWELPSPRPLGDPLGVTGSAKTVDQEHTSPHNKPPTVFPPPWASDWCEDRYGYRAGLRITGSRQGFRWLPPGKFIMGSPSTEQQRGIDEVTHPVMISQGLWLADTACTQALWQIIMQANPSRFHGSDRPVESVSYDLVKDFITALNKRVPGLDARLPTEAQWEYAYRAGTDTTFWFGDHIPAGFAHYDASKHDGPDPPGLWQAETALVATLPPNPWGLYQMPGNVSEWCADWYGPYDIDDRHLAGIKADPKGPAVGRSRVHRGGAWNDERKKLRAANRNWGYPFAAYDTVGFRLAVDD